MDFPGIGDLSDEQRQILYLPGTGDHVVMGAAGSGKTLMAAYRAIQLRTGSLSPLPTYLITYTTALAAWFKGVREVKESGVTATHLHGLVKDVSNGPLSYPGLEQHSTALNEAYSALSAEGKELLSLEFVHNEIDWIQGRGVESRADYLSIDRQGRGKALPQRARGVVWGVFVAYKATRDSAWVDYNEVGDVLKEAAAASGESCHIVLDEGQDLPPRTIRGLKAMAGAEGSFTWFGDFSQQLYGGRMSFRSLGLSVSRRYLFESNFRATDQLVAFAAAMQSSKWLMGSEDVVVPKPTGRSGPKPMGKTFEGALERDDWTLRHARSELGAGRSTAILTLTRAQAREFARGLDKKATFFRDGGPRRDRVYVSTVHSAKGLGFDSVIFPFAGSDDLPRPGVGEREGEGDGLVSDAMLLYVAVTRARERLLLGAVGEPTFFLPRDRSLYGEGI